MRRVPIFTFNQQEWPAAGREAPGKLIDENRKRSWGSPAGRLNWPIGSGRSFFACDRSAQPRRDSVYASRAAAGRQASGTLARRQPELAETGGAGNSWLRPLGRTGVARWRRCELRSEAGRMRGELSRVLRLGDEPTSRAAPPRLPPGLAAAVARHSQTAPVESAAARSFSALFQASRHNMVRAHRGPDRLRAGLLRPLRQDMTCAHTLPAPARSIRLSRPQKLGSAKNRGGGRRRP